MSFLVPSAKCLRLDQLPRGANVAFLCGGCADAEAEGVADVGEDGVGEVDLAAGVERFEEAFVDGVEVRLG